MKHNFRIVIGMLALAIPLCLTAQVKPTKPGSEKPVPNVEKANDSEQPTLEQLEKPVMKPEKPEMKPEKPGMRPEKPGMKPEKPGMRPEKTEMKPEKPEKPGMKPNMPEKPMKPEAHEPKGGPEMPKISGFVQGMYQANLTDEGELSSNTFRMRRVRLSVDGKLSKTVSYKLQGDFVRSPMLVDAYLKYKPCNEFAIQVGQFKTPFTIESPINPVNLEIFDYGEIIQKLGGYSDVCGVGGLGRDIGIMATGDLFPIKDKGFSVVNYAVGVFNGNGPTTTDNNNRKDIVGRLELHPGLKDLTLSGSYYYGLYRNETVEKAEIKFPEYEDVLNRFGHGDRNRWTAGIQYNDGKFVIRGEYINGLTGYEHYVKTESGFTYTEESLTSNGYYAVAGYNFALGKDKSQKLMPVLRYEHFAQNAAIEKGGTNWYTVGLNYWPIKSLNFKLDYSLIQKESGTNTHRVVGILSYKF